MVAIKHIPITYARNNSTNVFQKLNTILYLCGLTDFWIEHVKLPAKFVKFYNFISIFIEMMMFLFMMMEVGAFFTQKHLTDKQAADRLVFGVSHPILYIYCLNLIYYKKDVREVWRQLASVLKKVYNDVEVEKQMIAKLKFYLLAYVTACGLCIMFYGASALTRYIKLGSPFTTVITAWPDVCDESDLAHRLRVFFYVFWWIYFTRVSASYILMLSMFISLSFQYRNLQCYFNDLNKIFDKPLNQLELEKEFEFKFRIGIKLHSDTLWCQRECQKIYSIIFSIQLLQTVAELVSVMSQMMTSERNFVNLAAVVSTTCGALISTGFLMWNAGDVTVEASYLTTAIYASGWQNCTRGFSTRTRKLTSVAMMQAQKPVVFTALGFFEISHVTYLTIVKSSYTVFSVMY